MRVATSWSADAPHVRGALLAAAFLLLALHGLGDPAIVGDDEAREVGIVQDVVRGHVLLPRFNDDLIPDKPILTHWLGALPVAAAGFSEAAVRLPSALAGAGTVWWTVVFGTRFLGPPAGLAAGAMLATTPALFSRARVARPDAVALLLVSLALGCAWRWWRDGDRRAATAAWAWLGLAAFAKGPVAPALVVTALVLFLLWQRDWRRVAGFVTPAGLGAFALLGGGWYVVAVAGWGEEFVQQHLLGRYVRNLAGGLASGGAYSPKSWLHHLTFYPLHLPAVLLPWTPVVAVALWTLWRRGGFDDPRARFLVCWVLAPVVVFTPAEWKLRYYLLPALPAAMLLAAPAAVRLLETLRDSPSPTRASTALGVSAAALAVAAAAVVLVRPDVLATSDRATLDALLPVVGGARGAAAGVGILAGIAAVMVACRAWGAVVALLGAGTAAWLAFGAPALEASTTARDGFRDFGRAVAARVPADAPLVFYGEPVRAIVVYAGRPIPTLGRRPERLPAGGWVLAFEPAYRALAEAGLVGPPILRGTGRIGNLSRGNVVLAAVLAAAGGAGTCVGTPVTPWFLAGTKLPLTDRPGAPAAPADPPQGWLPAAPAVPPVHTAGRTGATPRAEAAGDAEFPGTGPADPVLAEFLRARLVQPPRAAGPRCTGARRATARSSSRPDRRCGGRRSSSRGHGRPRKDRSAVRDAPQRGVAPADGGA